MTEVAVAGGNSRASCAVVLEGNGTSTDHPLSEPLSGATWQRRSQCLLPGTLFFQGLAG